MSAGLLDRAEEKVRNLMGSPRYRAAVLERLAWVYEQQREWRAALDIWRELPPENQREHAVVAAHYCCELGEAALAARDYTAALSGSRAVQDAFLQEAHAALGPAAADELDRRLLAQQPPDREPPPASA